MKRLFVCLVLFIMSACQSEKKPELVKCPIIDQAGDIGELMSANKCIDLLAADRFTASEELNDCQANAIIPVKESETNSETDDDRPNQKDFERLNECLNDDYKLNSSWVKEYHNETKSRYDMTFDDISDAYNHAREAYGRCYDFLRWVEGWDNDILTTTREGDLEFKIITTRKDLYERAVQRRKELALDLSRILFKAVSHTAFTHLNSRSRFDAVDELSEILGDNWLILSDIQPGLTGKQIAALFNRGVRESYNEWKNRPVDKDGKSQLDFRLCFPDRDRRLSALMPNEIEVLHEECLKENPEIYSDE